MIFANESKHCDCVVYKDGIFPKHGSSLLLYLNHFFFSIKLHTVWQNRAFVVKGGAMNKRSRVNPTRECQEGGSLSIL